MSMRHHSQLLPILLVADEWASLQLPQLEFLDTVILHASFLSGTRLHQDFGWLSLSHLLASIPPSSSLQSINLHLLLPDIGTRTSSYLRDFCWRHLDSILVRFRKLQKVMFSLHLFLRPGIRGVGSEADVITIIQNALPSINSRNILAIRFCTQDWTKVHNFSYWVARNTCCR